MLSRDRWLLAHLFALLFVSAAFAQTPHPQAAEADCSTHEKPDALVLKTATTGLYYDLVGRGIATSFSAQKADNIPKIQAVCGLGSAENIQKLGENSISFAIVQSDVAHAAWYRHPRLETCPGRDQTDPSHSSEPFLCQPGEPRCPQNARPVVLTPLYIEAMHILIRPHLNIATLQDLRGRRVWAGGVMSGGRFSAERILSAAGVPYCSIDFVESDPAAVGRELSLDSALQSLGEMQIDAVFFTGPVPTHPLEDALDQFPEIHFFGLSYDLVQKLTQDESYTEALIRAEDYGKPDATLTVGVEALLMTHENANRRAVHALAEFIHSRSGDLRDTLRDLLETQKANEHETEVAELTQKPQIWLHRLKRWHDFKHKKDIVDKLSAATASDSPGDLHLTFDEREALKDYMEGEEVHEGVARLPLLSLPTPDALVRDFYSADPVVKKYFSRPRSATWMRHLSFVLVGCLFLLAIVFALLRRKLHRVLVRQPEAVLVTIATILAWALGSYLLYHYEALVNEDFNPLWKSFYKIFLYFTPFLGKTALTPNGQQTIQVLKWLGILLVGGFLSPFIRKIMATDLLGPLIAWLQGRSLMQKDITGHFVVINWDHRGREIVRHLSAIKTDAARAVVVVTSSRVDFTEEDCLEDVIGVVGDATQAPCLEKARVPFAHSVTILSTWKASDPNERRQSVDPDVADTKTIQTLRALRNMCGRQPRESRPTVTAEIRSSANRSEAETAGGDEIQVEIVCVDAIANDVLVQSALNPGMATLYTHLMGASATGNGSPSDTEVLRKKVPPELFGKSFGEMLEYFANLRRGHGPTIVPVGLCRASRVFVNPSDEKIGRLQEGDILFALAERQPAKTANVPPETRATMA